MTSGFPRFGYVKGLGRVRILAYLGDDRFEVLTNRDVRVVLHRDRTRFQKEKP